MGWVEGGGWGGGWIGRGARGDILFLLFVYLTRHKISITLVSDSCLEHMQSTSIPFIK